MFRYNVKHYLIYIGDEEQVQPHIFYLTNRILQYLNICIYLHMVVNKGFPSCLYTKFNIQIYIGDEEQVQLHMLHLNYRSLRYFSIGALNMWPSCSHQNLVCNIDQCGENPLHRGCLPLYCSSLVKAHNVENFIIFMQLRMHSFTHFVEYDIKP